MILKLTPEMRIALQDHAGQPVKIEDEQSQKVYLLVEEGSAHQLMEQWLCRELQVGFDQAERGDVVEWNADRIKSEGRRRLQERSSEP
jgi:hypothetical protein